MDVIHNGTIPSGSNTMTHEVALVRYWIPKVLETRGGDPPGRASLEARGILDVFPFLPVKSGS